MKLLKFFTLLLFSILASLAFAAPKSVTIGLDNANSPPYFYHGANKILGTNIRRIETAFRRLGVDVKWKLIKTNQLEKALTKNQVDFIYPANIAVLQNKNHKNQNIFYFSKPVQTTNFVFYQLASSNKPEPITKLKIGVMHFANTNINNKLKKKQYDNSQKILEDLQKNKIDIALVNTNTGNYLIQHILNGNTPIVINPRLPTVKIVYELATKKYKTLIADLNKIIDADATKHS